MQVTINDDFDLEKISRSGQCFRVGRFPGGVYRFITGGHVLYIQKSKEPVYRVSCDEATWNAVWREYFDLGRNYKAIRDGALGKHPFIDRAMEAGRGLRILRQEPWETMVTFIASQRKSIPAISKTVEALARKFGDPVTTGWETAYTFPSPEALAGAEPADLRDCGLGYRWVYVMDAIRRAASGELDLRSLEQCGDQRLFEELQKIYGVGKKVANCVCLFGYGRTASVPVDVWIDRAVREECGGESPFCLYGEHAGIMQQYVFYYQKVRQR